MSIKTGCEQLCERVSECACLCVWLCVNVFAYLCVCVCVPQATGDKVRQGCVLINQRLVSHYHHPRCFYSWELVHAGHEIILYWFTSLSLYLLLSVCLVLSLYLITVHLLFHFHCAIFFLSLLLLLSLSLSVICSATLSCFSISCSNLCAGSSVKHPKLYTTVLVEGTVSTHPIMFLGHFIRL